MRATWARVANTATRKVESQPQSVELSAYAFYLWLWSPGIVEPQDLENVLLWGVRGYRLVGASDEKPRCVYERAAMEEAAQLSLMVFLHLLAGDGMKHDSSSINSTRTSRLLALLLPAIFPQEITFRAYASWRTVPLHSAIHNKQYLC